MIHWAYILLASLSWTFAFRQYVSPDRRMPWYAIEDTQWWLLGAALVLATIGLRRRAAGGTMPPDTCHSEPSEESPAPSACLPTWYMALAAPLGASLWLAEAPYQPALLLTSVGILLLAGPAKLRWLYGSRALGLAALVLGVIGLAQSPVYWMATAWTARHPEAPYAATILYPVLKWIGCDASLSGGVLYVRTMRHVHAFPVTWDHLSLYPFTLAWIGGVVLLWLDRRGARRLARLTRMTVALIVCALARFALTVLIFLAAMLFVGYYEDVVHVEVLWLPEITALTMLPFVVVLGRYASFGRRGPMIAVDSLAPSRYVQSVPGDSAPRRNQLGPRGRTVFVCVTAGLACFSVTALSAYYDPGIKKSGRVLLDESHSRWERSDRPYDPDWYGHQSGYNYASMADYIGHFYDLTTHLDGPVTAELLADADVLILKTPTEPYSPEEVDAIERFVLRGGGLFALGEHTNVFGTGVCLNGVLRRFGIAFRYDSVFDIEHKWEQVYFPPRYGRHPAIEHVPFFRFAVSCSIDSVAWGVRPVIRSTGLWSLPIEYAASNFYPQVKDHSYARFGAHDQCLSTTAGRGRVLAFGDSTVYSNFLAFYPGKPEYLIGGIEWLNRKNGSNWICAAMYVLVGICGAAMLHWYARRRVSLGELALTASCGAAVTWLTLWGCTGMASASYPWPEPRRPVQMVVFDVPHSDYDLPIFGFTQDFQRSYEVFYQWVLRLGFFPKAAFRLDGLSSRDVLVIIKPRKPYSPEDLDRIERFVEGGGRLLILDGPPPSPADVSASTADAVLSRFELSIARTPCAGKAIVEPSVQTQICRLPAAQAVGGGDALLKSDSGETLAAWRRVGKGIVVAAGLAERFGDPQMGGSIRAIPTAETRAAYELEFALLRGLATDDLAGEMTRLGRLFQTPGK